MGWKGTVRSIGAAVRAAERDAKRRQRELEKQQKQFEKMQELEQAAHEVNVYENYIDVICSLHTESSNQINWGAVRKEKSPIEPVNENPNESIARERLESYKPGIIDRLFSREEKVRDRLQSEIVVAKEQDESSFRKTYADWEVRLADWKESVELAQRLLDGDPKAKVEVIDELNPFTEISKLGSGLSFEIQEGSKILEVELNIHSSEIIPSETKSLLSSGRLSTKKMAKGVFNELYQDYVCSAVIRVANEIFAVLPDDIVIVSAVDDLLNSKTGHLEKSAILSVIFSRDTLGKLNLSKIDPSDSMSNFVHNMDFKRTTGFKTVHKIEPSETGFVGS
jgi:hypothetical protein